MSVVQRVATARRLCRGLLRVAKATNPRHKKHAVATPTDILRTLMYEISVDYTFAAGHALRDYKGKCENVHGHNYKLRVTIEGAALDSTGLLIDFIDV